MDRYQLVLVVWKWLVRVMDRYQLVLVVWKWLFRVMDRYQLVHVVWKWLFRVMNRYQLVHVVWKWFVRVMDRYQLVHVVWVRLVRIMVFNATFNNISVISWRLVLLVKESTRRKPPTCCKSLTNFITLCCIEYTSPRTGLSSQLYW